MRFTSSIFLFLTAALLGEIAYFSTHREAMPAAPVRPAEPVIPPAEEQPPEDAKPEEKAGEEKKPEEKADEETDGESDEEPEKAAIPETAGPVHTFSTYPDDGGLNSNNNPDTILKDELIQLGTADKPEEDGSSTGKGTTAALSPAESLLYGKLQILLQPDPPSDDEVEAEFLKDLAEYRALPAAAQKLRASRIRDFGTNLRGSILEILKSTEKMTTYDRDKTREILELLCQFADNTMLTGRLEAHLNTDEDASFGSVFRDIRTVKKAIHAYYEGK